MIFSSDDDTTTPNNQIKRVVTVPNLNLSNSKIEHIKNNCQRSPDSIKFIEKDNLKHK
jgi:hypothetical protein